MRSLGAYLVLSANVLTAMNAHQLTGIIGIVRNITVVFVTALAGPVAAATLVELGFARAGDVVGGFAAWREAGLPTVPSPPYLRGPGEPAGMRPPDR